MAAERDRADVREARHHWMTTRQKRMRDQPSRLIFVGETAITTKMVRLPLAARDAPARRRAVRALEDADLHRRPALRRGHRSVDRRQGDGPHRLRPLGRDAARAGSFAGDVVILDNLAVHKSAKASKILKEKGAWFLFLPAYSPDLNPIEMAFSKLKAHLRATAARTFDALWRAVGSICDLFSPQECWNYSVAAGCARD